MNKDMLSPLCRGLFDYMSALDYEGLSWDEAEALEALAPVIELERRLEAVRPWLRHSYECDTENFGKPCTCGLDAALGKA